MNSADLCPIAVFGDVFGQPFVIAVQKVLFHILRIPAGWWSAAHGFGHFSNVNRRGAATDAQISDVILPRFGDKISDFVAVAV